MTPTLPRPIRQYIEALNFDGDRLIAAFADDVWSTTRAGSSGAPRPSSAGLIRRSSATR